MGSSLQVAEQVREQEVISEVRDPVKVRTVSDSGVK